MSPTLRLRVSLWYATNIGALACIPYMAVLLGEAGLSHTEVAGTLIALPLGMLLGGPLWSLVSDYTGAAHVVLRLATGLQAVAGILFVLFEGPTGMAAAILLYALARAPQSALADAMTVELLGKDHNQYGQYRAWGSAAYLVMALSGGVLRDHVHPRSPIYLAVVLMLASAAVTWTLPPSKVVASRPSWSDVRTLLTHPVVLPLLLVAVLQGLCISTYDNLFSLHVEGLGHGASVVGVAVALGVGVEVGVLALGPSLLDRVGPRRLMLVAVGCGIPRWLLTATVVSAPVLIATQALHGIMFGAFWISGVSLLARSAPPGLARSAQSLLPASAFGAGYLLSMTGATALLQVTTLPNLWFVLAGVSVVATALVATQR